MPKRPDSFTLDREDQDYFRARCAPTHLIPGGLSRSCVLRGTLRAYQSLLEGALPRLAVHEWQLLCDLLRDADLGWLESGEIPHLPAMMNPNSQLPSIQAIQQAHGPSTSVTRHAIALLQPLTDVRSLAVMDAAHRINSRALAHPSEPFGNSIITFVSVSGS